MGNPCLDLCSPGAMRSQQSAMHSYRTVRHRPRRRELRGTFTVDAAIYAQPLYVSGLNIGGGTHNVVYVATLNDSVYAIDADTYGPQPSNFTIYWSRTGNTSLIYDCGPHGQIVAHAPNLPSVGILSTPVIDASAGVDVPGGRLSGQPVQPA